jgi:hypothetical protein
MFAAQSETKSIVVNDVPPIWRDTPAGVRIRRD